MEKILYNFLEVEIKFFPYFIYNKNPEWHNKNSMNK